MDQNHQVAKQRKFALEASYFDWTPDGTAVVTYAKDSLRMLDVESGTDAQIPFRRPVQSVAIGTTNLVGVGTKDGEIQVFRLPSWDAVFTHKLPSKNVMLDFSHDGACLGCSGENSEDVFFDTLTWQPKFRVKKAKRYHRTFGIAFDTKSNRFATLANGNREIRIWESKICESAVNHVEECDVLVLAANTQTNQLLSLKNEVETIQQQLGASSCRVVVDLDARIDNLSELITRLRPRLLHLAGHGSTCGAIYLPDEHGIPVRLYPGTLGRCLASSGATIDCVVLNACYSLEHADELSHHVHAVIGMPAPIDDESARLFSKGFYRGVSLGKTYRDAFDMGKTEIELRGANRCKPEFVSRSFKPKSLLNTVVYRSDTDANSMPEEVPSVTLWFGTNRKPISSSNEIVFTSESDNSLHCGTCEVAVPDWGRTTGKLGSPWWWRWITGHDDRVRLENTSMMGHERFWRDLHEKMSIDNPERHALIFIHGFNVSFEDAARRAAQISVDLPFPGPTAFYSWPSQGRLLGYNADGDSIRHAEPFLAKFLIQFIEKSNAQRIHIIAHSMGNRGFVHSLARVLDRVGDYPFDQIFLAAPDVEVNLFTQRTGILGKAAKQITMYASPKDWAVWSSSVVNLNNRVGFHPPILQFEGIHTVRIEQFDVSDLGHGYFNSAASVLHDINQAIRFCAPPEARRLKLRQKEGHAYWVMP
ncbi:MAG: alpha/beta hydrolase [Pirellulaceae bacterium]